ncbi:MAG: hypothetical protein ABI119_11200 [Gemmatimonadaceae bacterium]
MKVSLISTDSCEALKPTLLRYARIATLSCFCAAPLPALALSVTQPTSSTVVSAGDDFATQVLGNAWDMNDAVDVDTEESLDYISGLTFSGGNLSGTTSVAGAGLFPLYMGLNGTINMSRGEMFPIATGHYRYLTFKSRVNAASQAPYAYVYLDGGSTATGTIGVVGGAGLTANQWNIQTIDMNNLQPVGGAGIHWTDHSQVGGLRIDPANASGVYFNIDWIRLTAPATASEKTQVQWTDSGYSGGYTVTAIDANSVAYVLGTTSGSSFLADTSFLAPGAFQIQVARTGGGGTTAFSQTFHINTPPQPAITSPSVRGNQSQDFATAVAGNPWGPIDASDFSTNGMMLNGVINFKFVPGNSSYYTTPVGSFHGRPTNADPEWFLNLHGLSIDTSIYRSLCFKQLVYGPRSIFGGSIARLFWGTDPVSLTTSDDIVLHDNAGDSTVSEYCIPDLAAVPVEPGGSGGTWSGMKSVFRIDPSEFTPGSCSTPDTCHDVRLDSVTLSPFAHANPNYTFTWTLSDPDNASDTIDLYLDPDTNPDNGNEILIHSQTAGNGNGQFVYTGSGLVASGTYHALIVADDGYNAVAQYAGGPIIVTSSDVIFRNGFETTP